MAHDVNQSETDVAAQVRSALVEKISSERYDLWIPDSTRWDWRNGTLTLTFGSEFSCQLAKKMLIAEVAQALKSVVTSDAEIQFDASPTIPVAPPTRTVRMPRAVVSDDTRVSGPVAGRVGVAKASAEPRASSSCVTGVDARCSKSGHEIDLWERVMLGDANRLAWTTANMIVSEPGRLSPVFLYGPHGSGKTMLIGAIAQQLRTVRRLRRVVHMTSEQFTNDFTEGLRAGGLPMFRRKYRDVEALVLDDIQFFVGKKSTLAELKHTIDNLIRLGKQVVVTADRSLNELNQLGTELTGRLRGGLVTPLFPLDQEMRVNLLTRQLETANIEIDQALVDQLAARICGDGRVLTGIVNRLTAVAKLHPEKMTWDTCWNAVYDLVQATQPIVRLGDIERAVCAMFGLEAESLQSQSKMRSVTQPRMLAMFLARKYTPSAYKEIGQYFGRRQHSTVISAEKTVEGWLTENSSLQLGRGITVREAIRNVEAQLQVG